jgi:hypothetical protein
MAVTREQFESGMTYDEFKASMTRNREQLERNEQNVQLSDEDLAAFSALPRPVNVLALAEDWCGDVIANLPILGRLARDSGKLNVRVHLRDQQPGSSIMDQYLFKGQFRSIPIFVFLDDDFNELGLFTERPASVTARREEGRRAMYAENPEFGSPDAPIADLPEDVRLRVQQATLRMREEMAPFANAEVVRELRNIVGRPAAAGV